MNRRRSSVRVRPGVPGRGRKITPSVSVISSGEISFRCRKPLPAARTMSASEMIPARRPVSSRTGRRRIWWFRRTRSASPMLSSGEQANRPLDMASRQTIALGAQFFDIAAMQMSRSVIIPITRPLADSRTGTDPQSQSHIRWAGTSRVSSMVQLATSRVIRSDTRIPHLLFGLAANLGRGGPGSIGRHLDARC